MRPRNSDGTTRHANRPKRLSDRSLSARWVEAEALHLKQLGMSYQEIAEHLIRVARGAERALVEIPQEISFPENYRISVQAVHRAFHRAIARLPNTEAEAYRKLDTERLEAMLLSLQAAIRKGDPKSVEAGLRLLEHKARINGYLAPSKLELTGKQGGPLAIETFRRMCEEAEREQAEAQEANDDATSK